MSLTSSSGSPSMITPWTATVVYDGLPARRALQFFVDPPIARDKVCVTVISRKPTEPYHLTRRSSRVCVCLVDGGKAF